MKTNLFYSLLLGIMMLGVSCDPPFDVCFWYVKNNTEQIIRLKCPYDSAPYSNYSTITIAPGDSVAVFRGNYEKGHNLSFEHYFEFIVRHYGEDVSVQVLSESDEVLKTWIYSDKGLPDQRFFDKSQWTLYQRPVEGAFDGIGYGWTFEIIPDDVSGD